MEPDPGGVKVVAAKAYREAYWVRCRTAPKRCNNCETDTMVPFQGWVKILVTDS